MRGQEARNAGGVAYSRPPFVPQTLTLYTSRGLPFYLEMHSLSATWQEHTLGAYDLKITDLQPIATEP